MPACRIMIVHEDPLARAALWLLLHGHAGCAVVAEASRGYEALAGGQHDRPDLAIVSERLPGLSGLQIADALRRQPSPPQILLLGDPRDRTRRKLAAQMGVAATLPRKLSPPRLWRAVAAVQVDTAESRAPAPCGTTASDLPPRLLQLLDCLLLGYTVTETSRALGLAEQTVKNRTSELLRRLGATDRLAALRIAVERGWTELGRPAPVAPTAGTPIAGLCLVRRADGKAAWRQVTPHAEARSGADARLPRAAAPWGCSGGAGHPGRRAEIPRCGSG